ncbi:Tautomerase/MIF superfamily [Aspergillus crustosus]
MPQKRHRIDFSLLRRRQNTSSASSSDLSPTIPILESPISFHALASQNVSEATLKQTKLNRAPVMPSMFFDDKEEDDDGTVPNLTTGDHKDARTARAAHKSSVDERPLIRTKSQFFDNTFNARSPWISPSARVSQDSLVVIEIKMNINVKDEDSIISGITTRMAQIYQRSETFMVVTVQKDSSLRFGNTTLPAYTMKIFALPYLIAPITNLRSTILIQAALHEILHITPARGVILYIPVAEENMATNSTTMMGEIARLERETHDREPGIFKSLSRSLSRRKKSSSGVSAPLSVATTSSWAAGSDNLDVKPGPVSESEGANPPAEESNGRHAKSSRTLRLFVSRRTPEHSGRSGDEE